MQLAGDIQNPALQSHFVRMATAWTDRAVRGPNGDTRMESAYPDSESKQTEPPGPHENFAAVVGSGGVNSR
jgi:hypothetical protein